MGDVDVVKYDEQDEVSAEVSGSDVLGATEPLYIPDTWTDYDVHRFEQAVATLPADKRGVTMLKTRFSNFKRHYELLGRDTASLKKTIQYLEGKRSSGPRYGNSPKALRKTAQAFFTNMSEQLLYKQAKVFGLNAAMYQTNDELIAALVEQHITAHDS